MPPEWFKHRKQAVEMQREGVAFARQKRNEFKAPNEKEKKRRAEEVVTKREITKERAAIREENKRRGRLASLELG